MSLSLFDNPSNTIQAVERPIFWEFQSDRVTDLTTTVSSVASASGFAKYTLSAVHSIQVGDVVLGSGMSDSAYNTYQNVTAVDQTTVTTDATYTATDTGTLTRTNRSFRVKADIYKGTGESSAISGTSNDGGNIQFTVPSGHGINTGDTVAVSGAILNYSLTSIADDSGKVQYTIGSHLLSVGDVIIVKDNDIDADYNTTQRVIAVTGTTVTTDIDTGSTGTPGAGSIDWYAHDGIHTVTGTGATTVTINKTYGGEIVTVGKISESTLVVSKKAEQMTDESGNSIFRFNVSPAIKTQLSFDLPVLTSTDSIITTNTGSITEYNVHLTEQFEDADGAMQDGTELQTAVGNKAVNVALQHTDTQNMDAYTVDSSAKLFLTKMPTTGVKYVSGDLVYLSFLSAESAVDVQLDEYDSDGSLVLSTSSWVGSTTLVLDRGIIVIDTSNLQSSTTQFVARLKQFGGSQRSVTMTFDLDSKCYDREIKVWWLDSLGNFDFYRFTRNRQNTLKVGKTDYVKPLGKGFAVNDRGASVLGVRAVEEIEIYSDWIIEEQGDWLSEIVSSKHVYVEETARGAASYVPIMVTSSEMIISDSRSLVQMMLRYNRPEKYVNG